MKCCQCQKPAMYAVGPEGKQVPLCLDCYSKFSRIEAQHNENLEKNINYLTDQIALISGVPINFPKFPERRTIQTSDFIFNNINVDRSYIGLINTGSIANLDSDLTILKNIGEEQLSESIKNLSQAVLDTKEATNELKNQIIEILSIISNEASKPNNVRRKSAIRPLIQTLHSLLNAIPRLAGIWEKLKPLIESTFN